KLSSSLPPDDNDGVEARARPLTASGDAPAPTIDTSSWFGPAVSAVSRSAAILRHIARRPVRLSRRKTVTVTALRELADATHDVPEHAALLISILRGAGLATVLSARPDQFALAPSPSAREW